MTTPEKFEAPEIEGYEQCKPFDACMYIHHQDTTDPMYYRRRPVEQEVRPKDESNILFGPIPRSEGTFMHKDSVVATLDRLQQQIDDLKKDNTERGEFVSDLHLRIFSMESKLESPQKANEAIGFQAQIDGLNADLTSLRRTVAKLDLELEESPQKYMADVEDVLRDLWILRANFKTSKPQLSLDLINRAIQKLEAA